MSANLRATVPEDPLHIGQSYLATLVAPRITPCPSIVLPLNWTNNTASGAGREGSQSRLLWFFIAKRAQTPATPRRGGGLGPLSYEEPHKSRPRDPSRPVSDALLFPNLGEALLRDLG